jgi:nucleoside-diphosphate-sugar epimerase
MMEPRLARFVLYGGSGITGKRIAARLVIDGSADGSDDPIDCRSGVLQVVDGKRPYASALRLSSDDPMSPGAFWAYNAERMGVSPPANVSSDRLTAEQQPMRILAMSVSNAKSKRDLGLTPQHPSHRAIADAILAETVR